MLCCIVTDSHLLDLAPLTKDAMSTVNHHAIYLLLVKLLFINGTFADLASLIEVILKFPALVIGALQQIKSHWYLYMSRMCHY